MISKEEFIKLIDWQTKQNERLDKLNEVIPDCFSADIFDSPFHLLDMIFKICFDEEGQDWISWWLYDSITFSNGKPNRTYTEDGKTINVETVDDLWKLVKGCRK